MLIALPCRNYKQTESDEEDETYESDSDQSDGSDHWFDDYADDEARGHPLIPEEELEDFIQVDRAQLGYPTMNIER